MFTCNVGDDLVLLSAPLPVINLTLAEENQVVSVMWTPAPGSVQQMYYIAYSLGTNTNRDYHSLMTNTTWISVESVFPGRTHDFYVHAVSNSVYSEYAFQSIVIGEHGFTVSVFVVNVCGSSIALLFLDGTLYISMTLPVTYQFICRLVVICCEVR